MTYMKNWGEILSIISGKNQKAVTNPNGKYPIYGSGGRMGYADEYLCPPGTTIIGRKGTINSPIYVDEYFWNVDTAFGLVPGKELHPKYLYYFCISFNFKKLDKSTTIPSLAKSDLLNIEMPVPPIPEQERIVARIEELFSQLDSGVETLKKTKEQLAVYRQAVMMDAFSGRITADWRKVNSYSKPNYIYESHRVRDQLAEKSHAKKLKYSFPEKITLYQIPEEWEFIQIGDVAWSIKDGPHFSPPYSETGVPFITGGNVRPHGVDFENAKKISPELHEEFKRRCFPEKGDMLYTKGGTTGIARVNTYDFPFSVWVHVAVIKYANTVLPEYFQHVLNSPFCYRQSQDYTHGVGNQDLGLTRMINIVFPICSMEEQRQIVKILESRLSVFDSIEKTVDASLQQAEAMRQSILKKAFEG